MAERDREKAENEKQNAGTIENVRENGETRERKENEDN